jgi:hypothetical protein
MAHSLVSTDFLSFNVELGPTKTSADGFEDGPTLGSKLGIGSAHGVKLASADSPQSKNQQMTNKRTHSWNRYNS